MSFNKSILAKLFPYVKPPAQQFPGKPGVLQQPDSNPTPATPVHTPMRGNVGPSISYEQPSSSVADLDMFSSQRPDASTPQPSASPSGYPPQVMELPNTLRVPQMLDRNGNEPAPDFGFLKNEDERDLATQQWRMQHAGNEDHGWKGRLKEIAQNFVSSAQQAGPNSSFWEMIGAGLGGAGTGAIDRSQNERRAAAFKIPIIRDQIQNRQQREYQDARVRNIDADNELAKLRIENENLYKQGTLGLRKEAEQNKSVAAIAKSPWFSKQNPAQMAQAKAAGLDPESMADWDFRDPVKATVNGDTYHFNRMNGAWEPSGLPASEKDKIVPLSVSVPGEKAPRIFNVPQGQAATVAASLQAAGMQIQAATMAREDQQKFTAGENEKGRKERLQAWKRENNVTRAKFQADLNERVATGRLTQEQADLALKDFDEQ